MQSNVIIAFGRVAADGKKIDGSDNWASFKDEDKVWKGADGVYRVDFTENFVQSPTVILSAGDHDTEGGTKRGIKQSDNIFVPFDVSGAGFGVNSRDISGDNAGNEDAPFNFVVLGVSGLL